MAGMKQIQISLVFKLSRGNTPTCLSLDMALRF